MRCHDWCRIFFCKMKEKEIYNELLSKLKRYCKYQERCKSDVESKLSALDVPDKIKELIIHKLSEKEFFNNKRFSSEYVVGKFRNNNWGKIKIRYNLKCKCIEKETIDEALKKIPEDEYSSTFNEIAKKEWIKRKNLNLSTRRRRFSNTLQSRGWEFYLIKDFIDKQIKNKDLID